MSKQYDIDLPDKTTIICWVVSAYLLLFCIYSNLANWSHKITERRLSTELKTGAMAFLLHIFMYSWWIFADVLLSDDYGLYKRAPNLSVMTHSFFRPLHEHISTWISEILQRSPDMIYWIKAGQVFTSAVFCGIVAIIFVRITKSMLAGLGIAILISTNPGAQINSIWLCIAPQWPLYIITALIFWSSINIIERSSRTQIIFFLIATIIMSSLMLVYQLPPFYLIGLTAAFLVLNNRGQQITLKLSALNIAIATTSILIYGTLLEIATNLGIVTGRAAQATNISIIPDRFHEVVFAKGLHWFNLFLNEKTSATAVITIIVLGSVIDLITSKHRKECLLRWIAATFLTAFILIVPAVLNDFQKAARLYTPGAIGASGLMIASLLAFRRTIPVVKAFAIPAIFLLVSASNIATIIGFGQSQHAELQYIRSEIAKYDINNIKCVYLIPPDKGPFWKQNIHGPNHDMYIVRMSSYHEWTYEGLVRFALRYVDPTMKLSITSGLTPPNDPNTAVVDMRILNRSLYEIPY